MTRFPLAISLSRKHLVDAAGQQFLLRGDAGWSAAVQLSREDACRYLDNRQRRGFNAILVNLIEHRFSSQTPRWVNRQGAGPFAGTSDFARVNDGYFANVDALVAEAAARGMAVLLAPAYLGYDGGPEGWMQEMKANGPDRLRRYGRYVGERYRGFPNVIWVEGGDYTPSAEGTPSELDLVNAVARGIREVDGGAHLHTAHWRPGTSSAEVAGLEWLDLDAVYVYAGAHPCVKALEAFARDDGRRPFFLFESTYENEHRATPEVLRSQMYQPVLSGGTGFVFGNFPVWHFWSPGDPPWHLDDGGFPGGWRTALDTPGAISAEICGRFFAGLPWWDLRPDAAHKLVTAGFGALGSDEYALAASSPDGRIAVVYFTATLTVVVDLSRLSNPVRARWFDPSSGACSEIPGSPFPNSGSRRFTPPSANASGSPDFVLLLEGG